MEVSKTPMSIFVMFVTQEKDMQRRIFLLGSARFYGQLLRAKAVLQACSAKNLFLSISQNVVQFPTAIVLCLRFVWITDSSDDRRV